MTRRLVLLVVALVACGRPLAAAEPPRRIVVTLRPTGDRDVDKRRIQRVYESFVSHPGQDRFTLVVFEPDGRRFELDFMNDATRYSDELLRQLHKFVTPDVIEVHPLV